MNENIITLMTTFPEVLDLIPDYMNMRVKDLEIRMMELIKERYEESEIW